MSLSQIPNITLTDFRKVGFSISVSIPLIYVAINVQAFADLCQYLHYRFLLWIWIAILALLPRSGSCETWLRECREARDLYLKSRNESDKNKVSEKVGKPSDQPSSKDRSESSNQHNETESAENPQSRGWNWTRLRSRASKGEREKVETEV